MARIFPEIRWIGSRVSWKRTKLDSMATFWAKIRYRDIVSELDIFKNQITNYPSLVSGSKIELCRLKFWGNHPVQIAGRWIRYIIHDVLTGRQLNTVQYVSPYMTYLLDLCSLPRNTTRLCSKPTYSAYFLTLLLNSTTWKLGKWLKLEINPSFEAGKL